MKHPTGILFLLQDLQRGITQISYFNVKRINMVTKQINQYCIMGLCFKQLQNNQYFSGYHAVICIIFNDLEYWNVNNFHKNA